MSIYLHSLFHSIFAAAALLAGVQFLKLPHDQGQSQTQTTTIPNYVQEFEAYDFNHGFDSAGNAGSHSVFPVAATFFLAAIELAVLSVCFGMKSFIGFICASRSSDDAVPSRRGISESLTYFFHVTLAHSQFAEGTCVFLLSPLLALCAATQYAIWAPSVQASTPNAVLGLFLLPKLLFMLVLAKQSKALKRLMLIPSVSNSLVSVLSLLSVVGLLSFDSGHVFHLNQVASTSTVFISMLSCLTHFGPWLNGNMISAKNVHPLLITIQAMIASLFALFVSIMTDSAVPINESVQHLTMFGSIVFVSLGLRVFIPIATPIVPVELLRDQLSLILAWTMGFTDSSAISVKIIFLVLATTIVLLPQYGWPSVIYGANTQYSMLSSPTRNKKSKLPIISDDEHHPLNKNHSHSNNLNRPSKFMVLVVFRVLSIASLVMGIYLVFNPINSIVMISNSPVIAQPNLNAFDPQRHGLKHQHNAIPKDNLVKHVATVLFQVDPDVLPAEISKTKQSRQFSVNAHSHSFVRRNESTYDVHLPPVQLFPRRTSDPITDPNEIPKHAVDLSFDHIQFGISGNVRALMRTAFSVNSWMTDSRLQWTVFWDGNDEPNGITGELSYALESFKRVVGRYPVVMKGYPILKWSQNYKWFKMLPYLYKQAPRTTRWFMMCDDDTLIFPETLLNTIRSIKDDPLTTSMYIGDNSENLNQIAKFGRTMAYGGGGVLISRHLAERITDKYQWCVDTVTVHEGDGLLRNCIHNVTHADGLGDVRLTRNPAFNQIDFFEYWFLGREFLSAKLSRVAPATLHHLSMIPRLLAGMNNSRYTNLAMFDFWHLIHQVPLNLRFRRFFIHLGDGRTAVVTFGLHVRVYQNELDSIEHSVDWDGRLSQNSTYLGAPFILETIEDQVTISEVTKREDYTDYWLLHHADNALVFSTDEYTHEFHLKCKLGHQGILSLCSESL